MFTPRATKVSNASSSAETAFPTEISPLLAAELGLEYASLRAVGNCPTGMYITPSPETLLKWYGVFFVHRGPYAGSVLRFTINFPATFPQSAPVVRFDSDVFHPMVDPKTKIWYPRGRLVQWRPRVDHVPHLVHSIKGSFKSKALKSIMEDEAINKQVWSLYHHSRQTFQSMTSQRAMHSTSLHHLYPTAHPILVPMSPTRTQPTNSPFGSVSKQSQPPLFSPTKSSQSLPKSPAQPPQPLPKSPSGTRPSQPFPASPGITSIVSPSKMMNDSHRRTSSLMSASTIDEGPVVFKEMSEEDRVRLWEGLKTSLGQ